MNLRIPQFLNAFRLLIISTVLFSSSSFSYGQTNIAIAPKKLNVLYIGVDNPVSVAVSNSNDDRLTVSVSGGGGIISKIGSGLYNVRVAELTDECLINVYVDGKLTGTSSFRVRRLPVPAGTIGGFKSADKVTADAFRTQAGLGLYVQDFPFDVKYEVVDYTFTVNDEKGGVKSAYCQGALFSAEARQYIEQYVKPGHLVTIDNIRAKDQGGRELKIPALMYYIN